MPISVFRPSEPGFAEIERSVASIVRRKVPESDAEDLTQQIVLRILQRFESLRERESVEPWVRQVAKNAIVDFYRRRARQPQTSDLHDPPNPEPEDVSNSVSSQLAECLRPLVESLPSAFRQALIWVELDGMTQAEAARQAGISLSGMKSRVQRGRRLLKQRLLDCCSVELDARSRIVEYQERNACGCDSGGGAGERCSS